MIKLVNVTKEYEIGGETIQVLKNIDLTIKQGEFVGVLGASGSGKSTLMHIMGLLDQPTEGRVILDGKDVSRFNDDKLSLLRNEYVGFVFQQFNLIHRLSVFENVILPTIYGRQKLSSQESKTKALNLLRQFGILKRKDFYPNKISGGEQQRTAIARALIINPKLILADEPTGNLDSKTGKEILDLLEKLNSDFGATVVIVTHEQQVAKRTKRKIFIRDGRMVRKYL